MSNREIKFRVWEHEYKRMSEPFGIGEYYGSFPDSDDRCDIGIAAVDVLSYTVMQFTGLLDKNGVEIYEGDIIENPINFDAPMPVEFNALGCICVRDDTGQHALLTFHISKSEVISNVHENPELLTGES